jgi:hypothetical protein
MMSLPLSLYRYHDFSNNLASQHHITLSVLPCLLQLSTRHYDLDIRGDDSR